MAKKRSLVVIIGGSFIGLCLIIGLVARLVGGDPDVSEAQRAFEGGLAAIKEAYDEADNANNQVRVEAAKKRMVAWKEARGWLHGKKSPHPVAGWVCSVKEVKAGGSMTCEHAHLVYHLESKTPLFGHLSEGDKIAFSGNALQEVSLTVAGAIREPEIVVMAQALHEENNPKGAKANNPQVVGAKPLPEHRFQRATRGRSQIRAITQRGTLTRSEFEQLAVALANKHGAEFTLVQFFSDRTTLDGWDGSGGLRDSDWPHWLCQVGVDAGSEGKRHVSSFSVAKDMKTGKDRTDVLRVPKGAPPAKAIPAAPSKPPSIEKPAAPQLTTPRASTKSKTPTRPRPEEPKGEAQTKNAPQTTEPKQETDPATSWRQRLKDPSFRRKFLTTDPSFRRRWLADPSLRQSCPDLLPCPAASSNGSEPAK